MRQRFGLDAYPDDPHDNIFAGAAYRDMYERFGHPALFAACHAGPGAFQAYLDGRTSLSDETGITSRRRVWTPEMEFWRCVAAGKDR